MIKPINLIRLISKTIWNISKPITNNLIHNSKYIVRLDDSCETQDALKWKRMEELLDKFEIKPIVAVIPQNKDKKLFLNKKNKSFWKLVKSWQDKNWTIGLHGHQHNLHKIKRKNSIIPLCQYSEFAELSLKEQSQKIFEGYKIMEENDINPKLWISPKHTFDKNTIVALKNNTPLRIISDGFGLYPFVKNNIIYFPQQLWRAQKRIFGIWTICLHPNNFSNNDFVELEKNFSNEYFKNKFITIEDGLNNLRNNSLTESIFKKISNIIYRMYYWFKFEIKNLFS